MRVFSVIGGYDYEGFNPPAIFAHLCDALDEAERVNKRADWAELRVHTDEEPEGEELHWLAKHLGPRQIQVSVPGVSFGSICVGSIGIP